MSSQDWQCIKLVFLLMAPAQLEQWVKMMLATMTAYTKHVDHNTSLAMSTSLDFLT